MTLFWTEIILPQPERLLMIVIWYDKSNCLLNIIVDWVENFLVLSIRYTRNPFQQIFTKIFFEHEFGHWAIYPRLVILLIIVSSMTSICWNIWTVTKINEEKSFLHFLSSLSWTMRGPPESPLHDPCIPMSVPAQNMWLWNNFGSLAWTISWVVMVAAVWDRLHSLKIRY